MLPIALFTFAFALWLSLFLLARGLQQPALRCAGLGLVAYALAVSGAMLVDLAITPLQLTASRLLLSCLSLPPLFWSGAIVFLLPENDEVRLRLQPVAGGLLILGAPILYILTLLISDFLLMGEGGPPDSYLAFAAVLSLILLSALAFALRAYRRATTTKLTLGLLFALTLFFGLGVALLILPLRWLSVGTLMLLVAPDLLLLGAAVAFLDAFSEGEALWPGLLRSLTAASLVAILFGAQIGLVIWQVTGVNFAMVGLLLLTVATAILVVTFSAPLASALDRLVLASYPEQLRERRHLQSESEAALRRDPTLDPLSLPENQFMRLTRRAFSHMNNLPRLASSPLTQLPEVERRLRAQKRKNTSLERASILRDVLIEGVERLKPSNEESFASGDEWRFYNALYFPYVVGLKPYSRRANRHDLDDAEWEALHWFRREVPQRTLYNWQTAAAELVARDLRERSCSES